MSFWEKKRKSIWRSLLVSSSVDGMEISFIFSRNFSIFCLRILTIFWKISLRSQNYILPHAPLNTWLILCWQTHCHLLSWWNDFWARIEKNIVKLVGLQKELIKSKRMLLLLDSLQFTTSVILWLNFSSWCRTSNNSFMGISDQNVGTKNWKLHSCQRKPFVRHLHVEPCLKVISTINSEKIGMISLS